MLEAQHSLEEAAERIGVELEALETMGQMTQPDFAGIIPFAETDSTIVIN